MIPSLGAGLERSAPLTTKTSIMNNNRDILSRILTGDPAAVEMMTGPTSGKAQSGAVRSVPIDGTLPDDVSVYFFDHTLKLGTLKARNAGKGLWALFTPAYKQTPYAVFDGVNRVDREDWPEPEYWDGALSPTELKKDGPFNFKMMGEVKGIEDSREGWSLPGFAWANR